MNNLIEKINSMPRKTLIILLGGILIFSILVTTLIVFLYSHTTSSPLSPTQSIAELDTGEAPSIDTYISFATPNIEAFEFLGEELSSDVLLDVEQNTPVTGVTVELNYDPDIFAGVDISPALEPTSFFGPDAEIVTRERDFENGVMIFTVTIPNGGQPIIGGSGRIGNLTFTPRADVENIEMANISFNPESTIAFSGELGDPERIATGFSDMIVLFTPQQSSLELSPDAQERLQQQLDLIQQE